MDFFKSRNILILTSALSLGLGACSDSVIMSDEARDNATDTIGSKPRKGEGTSVLDCGAKCMTLTISPTLDTAEYDPYEMLFPEVSMDPFDAANLDSKMQLNMTMDSEEDDKKNFENHVLMNLSIELKQGMKEYVSIGFEAEDLVVIKDTGATDTMEGVIKDTESKGLRFLIKARRKSAMNPAQDAKNAWTGNLYLLRDGKEIAFANFYGFATNAGEE